MWQDPGADCHSRQAALEREQQPWCRRTGRHLLPMCSLTCVSLVVSNEALGEEPDHQSCGSERRDGGLALALK